MAATSARDVWAAGIGVAHRDGRRWNWAPSLSWGFLALAAIGPRDVWAISNAFVHWDGAQWNSVPPAPLAAGTDLDALWGIGGVASDDVWVPRRSGCPTSDSATDPDVGKHPSPHPRRSRPGHPCADARQGLAIDAPRTPGRSSVRCCHLG